MFKRFSTDESISGHSAMKSSAQRNVREKLIEQMPAITEYILDLLPKKEKGLSVRCGGSITLVANQSGDPLFFQFRTNAFMPALRILHKYPMLLPVYRVDKGAIRHVINGADIMAPGVRGCDPDVERDQVVAIFAEGKEHAIAVGVAKMTASEIGEKKTGIAVENAHYLGDGLWKTVNLH